PEAVPCHLPELHRSRRGDPWFDAHVHGYAADVLLQRRRQATVRPCRPVPECGCARAGHQVLLQTQTVSGTLQYTVRRLAGEDEMRAALALRHEVFCVEQGVPEHEELDGRDHDGLHLVAVANGELLGTCRLLLVGPTAQFSRLAVKPSAR